MKAQTTLKRILVGHPMPSGELGHPSRSLSILLPSTVALPALPLEALPSVACAARAIIAVLGLGKRPCRGRWGGGVLSVYRVGVPIGRGDSRRGTDLNSRIGFAPIPSLEIHPR